MPKLTHPRKNQDPSTVAYWREKIFYSILYWATLLGTITLIPSIILCIKEQIYIQIYLDILALSIIIFFLINKSISYNIKTAIILAAIYFLGLTLVITRGPNASGFIYLMAFSIVASVWHGTRFAIATIILNILTLIILAFLSFYHVVFIPGFEDYMTTSWITIIANVTLINFITAIAVAFVLEGLDKTLTETASLKDQLINEKFNLIEEKLKVEETNHLKSSFLANMSHEFKTPLNTIIGFSQLIIEDKIDDLDEIYSHQKKILESGEMLLQLSNDVLDISVIEAGKIKINPQNISIPKLIKEITHTFDPTIIKKINPNITFKISNNIDTLETYIFTDQLRLKQVIYNLVKNALKFTSSGFIKLSVDFTENRKFFLFSIEDSGSGIDLSKQKDLFVRYNKGETLANNNIKGTGLGLAISKNIVELLGGNIWLHSKKDMGSTFYFTIPHINSPM